MNVRPWLGLACLALGCTIPDFGAGSGSWEEAIPEPGGTVIPGGADAGVQIGAEALPMGCEWQPLPNQRPEPGVHSPLEVSQGLTSGLVGTTWLEDGSERRIALDLAALQVWWDNCMHAYLLTADPAELWIDGEVWEGNVTLVGAPPAEDLTLVAWAVPDPGFLLGDHVSLQGTLGMDGGEGDVLGITPGLPTEILGTWELDRTGP